MHKYTEKVCWSEHEEIATFLKQALQAIMKDILGTISNELASESTAFIDLSKLLFSIGTFPNRNEITFSKLYNDICLLISHVAEMSIGRVKKHKLLLNASAQKKLHACLHYVVKKLIDNNEIADLLTPWATERRQLFIDVCADNNNVEELLRKLSAYEEGVKYQLFHKNLTVLKLLLNKIITLDQFLAYDETIQSQLIHSSDSIISVVTKTNIPLVKLLAAISPAYDLTMQEEVLCKYSTDILNLLNTGICTLDDLLVLKPSWQSELFRCSNEFICLVNSANLNNINFSALAPKVRKELFLDLCRITHMNEPQHLTADWGSHRHNLIVEKVKEKLQMLQPCIKEEPEAVTTEISASSNTTVPHGANLLGVRYQKFYTLITCIEEKLSSSCELELRGNARDILSEFLSTLDTLRNPMGDEFAKSFYHDICILISIKRVIKKPVGIDFEAFWQEDLSIAFSKYLSIADDATDSKFQINPQAKSSLHHCLHHVVKAMIKKPFDIDFEALGEEVKKLSFDGSPNTTYFVDGKDSFFTELSKYQSIADDLSNYRLFSVLSSNNPLNNMALQSSSFPLEFGEGVLDVLKLLKTGLATLDDLLELEPSLRSAFFSLSDLFVSFVNEASAIELPDDVQELNALEDFISLAEAAKVNKANIAERAEFLALNPKVRKKLFLDLCYITKLKQYRHRRDKFREEKVTRIVKKIEERLQTLQFPNKEEPVDLTTQKSAPSDTTMPPHGTNPCGTFYTSNPPSQEEESEFGEDLRPAWQWLGFNNS